MSNEVFSQSILRVKGKGTLSSESVVTARISVTFHPDDGSEDTFFQVQITANPSDLDLFLLAYTDRDDITLEVEILDVINCHIRTHDDNLKWLDNLKKLERDTQGNVI